ncbi:MAG: tetratricopeptide repeat protein [Xanthomonadales bacterium]|nr:tetratricopeptide repeat protein [Xanthomonadales bacterium]
MFPVAVVAAALALATLRAPARKKSSRPSNGSLTAPIRPYRSQVRQARAWCTIASQGAGLGVGVDSAEHSERLLYLYRFDDVEFDEARARLRVAGERVELEQRPLQVLALLLQRADEVVTRADLFDTVWAGRPTVDNVLANAVAKLRKALGAASARIVNVPRIGYRLRGPVERMVTGRRAGGTGELAAGQAVPGREHFHLAECLDPSGGGSVWLARHEKTGEPRVYKFAIDGERLAALKREVTIYRVLRESLGERDDRVRLFDWNFDAPPFFLECEYAGRDLARWAEDDPAFAAAPCERRIVWFIDIAEAVAAAHGAGVLHKDLKPANVLVAPRGTGWRFRVTDFGSGRLLESGRLQDLGITGLGLTVTSALTGDSGVTVLYLAPELLAGQAPSVRSDVYALGLMLFQMAVGDLRRTLAPGWEQDIDDELLREDIAAATNGDPQRRLQSVDELVQRLRSREARALERRRLRESDARALTAERLLERSRARRPWLLAAIVLLVAGLGMSLWQIKRVKAARTNAEQQAALASATNRFLNEDLLGAGVGGTSPAWYERNPTLREILDTAAKHLDDGRYAGEPLMLADLHQTLGRAYRSTGSFTKAGVQLQAAADWLQRTLGADDQRSVLAQYELATVLARLSRFAEADALLDRTDAAAGARRQATSEIALRAHLARGDVAYQQMLVKTALPEYQAAQRLQALLHPDDAAMSAHILLGIAGCDLRMGQPQQAEAAARRILAGAPYTQERIGLGTLANARSRLADALRGQGKYRLAIPVAQQSLADFEKAQGAGGQGTISALSTLSYLYSLSGDGAKALTLQRDVYERATARWGADNQYTLVELLNLGSAEYESGDLTTAFPHLQQAEAGLVRVSGTDSPVTQAARAELANALSDLGRNTEALALIEKVDPKAYQATTSDPDRALVLRAMKARIEWRLHQPDAKAALRDAITAMQKANMADDEIDTFRKELAGTNPRP